MACTRPAAQSTLTLARVVRCAPADADNGVHGQADLRAPLTRISHRSAARMHSFPDTPGVHAMEAGKQPASIHLLSRDNPHPHTFSHMYVVRHWRITSSNTGH